MAIRVHCILVFILSVVATCSINAETNSTACPDPLKNALASDDYSTCVSDMSQYDTTQLTDWVFRRDNKDLLHSSEACFTTLLAMLRADFVACSTAVPTSQFPSGILVTIGKHELEAIAEPCRRRHLRV